MRPKSVTRIRTGCARDTQTAGIARQGTTLHLNAKTQEGGSIRVELQDEDWTPLDGFGLDQSTPISGDHLEAPVTWGQTTQIPTARPLVLRFQLKRATLFGFEVVA